MKLQTKKLLKNISGFTLIEMVVYVTLLSIVSLVVISVLFQFLGINETSGRIRSATTEARSSLDTIAQEIRFASSVYTPTSVFGTSPGQLSLETSRFVPADENSTYVDFYVDNNGLYLKREGQGAQLLTSQKVKVTNLVFTNLNGYTGLPAIRTQITIQYKDPGNGPKEAVTLESTTALRSY